jgi:mRNA-degrading endonuclease toxin of MazEF toxin-antitoxin module
VNRGEVWLAEVGNKRRPVLVLTRTDVLDVRLLVTVAEISTSARGLAAEVEIDHDEAGLDQESVINWGAAQALDLARFWARRDTVPHTPDLVLRGLTLHQAHSLSVWDALIVQAGIDAGCSLLFSEDLQHGRRFGELEIVNPFIAPRAHEPRAAAYSAGRVRKRRRVR